MQQALDETERRRSIQRQYNETHGITPQTIQKEIVSIFDDLTSPNKPQEGDRVRETQAAYTSIDEIEQSIKTLESEMMAAARDLEFERAAELRDRIQAIKAHLVFDGNA
jgi:excinuclease ABC subunit B